jgi:hypothetical protein
MATGPEHYTESENLLELEKTISTKNMELRSLTATKALAHAVLALAAASAPTSVVQAEKWTKATR